MLTNVAGTLNQRLTCQHKLETENNIKIEW
jgi:hypothetical protein